MWSQLCRARSPTIQLPGIVLEMERGQSEPPRSTSSAPEDIHPESPSGGDLEITVVIPTFDSAEQIDACISSIHRCLPQAEVIVVDNGSHDATCEVVSRRFPTVVLLSGHGNVGFGSACNLATERASHEFVLYLNPDAELLSLDGRALALLMADRPFGMLAAMLTEDGAPPRSTLRRQTGHWLGEFVGVHILAMLSPYAPRPRYVQSSERRGLYTVGGAAFMVAKAEFRALGGFDERFFMYYEDTDLTQRYLQSALPVRASDALLASHVGGASAPAPRRNALSFLGWLEYIDKWHGRAAAERAGAIARASYSVLLSMLRRLGRITGNRRVEDKVEQIEVMLSNIATQGLEPDRQEPHGRYPAASSIARRRFASAVLRG
jgi:N-acetylglucosaminyl-diphospho-decaprenol L-rhamnosyltransferase